MTRQKMIPDQLEQESILRVKDWVAEWVLGQGLCPFAQAPFTNNRVGYRAVMGTNLANVLLAILDECRALAHAPITERETSLIIVPQMLTSFDAYLDALALAENLLHEKGWEGIFQLASFHPHYQFAGTAPDDKENFTNRSPYPIFHLLREASVSAAAARDGDLSAIPERNIATMNALSVEQCERARAISLSASTQKQV